METVAFGPVSVSQLNNYLKQRLDGDEALRLVCVEGEISNFTDHSSGHMYFSLKDKDAAIKAVMFRGYRKKLTFRPTGGMKVIAIGDVSFYSKAGTVQLYVQHMFPSGIGDIYANLEALKEKLSKEGLFDSAHKKEIPKYPENIAIITSPTGAALRDIRNVLGRRYPLARQVLYPVMVQGNSAALEIVQALETANRDGKCDVILLARGGGSLEELSIFNDEKLARAIYASQIPVITGIGHEIDYTIADYVADLRAPTPSAAAELAVPDQNELMLSLDNMAERWQEALYSKVQTARNALDFLKMRGIRSAEMLLERQEQRAILLKQRLCSGLESIALGLKAKLSITASALEAQNPALRFTNGFIYAEADGIPVRSISQLKPGREVRLFTKDGEALVEVQRIERREISDDI